MANKIESGGTFDSSKSGDMIGGTMASSMYKDGGGVKYPTDIKVGTIIKGIGFPMLKGIDGGNFYTVVETDNYSATLVKSDEKGNKKGKSKIRHYFSSLEGGIKTASRGDENGIIVVKYAKGGSLKGNQKKLDVNKNGKLDAEDFKMLRGKKKMAKGGKMEWGGTAESSETGTPIGGENESSSFENGGGVEGSSWCYSIGGL